MNSYGDVHRRFLQSFVYHPAKTEKEVLGVYHHACQEQGQQIVCLNKLVEEINCVIRGGSTTLEIKTGVCEVTSKKYYVATNTTQCSWMRSMSIYSRKEQYIFRKIVDELVRSSTGYVSSLAFLNIPVKGSITKSESIEILSKFVRDKWLSIKEGNYYMGARGAVELEPYIRQNYQDMLSFCPLCNKLIFWGHCCGACPEMAHIHCLRNYFGLSSHSPECPNCHVGWSNWDKYQNDDYDSIDDP